MKLAAEFLQQNIHVFAPVNYTSRILEKMELPSLEAQRTVIMPYLFEFLKVSKGLIVVMLEGWEKSWGVAQELKYCRENGIPVYTYHSWQTYNDLSEIISLPLDQTQIYQLLHAA